MSNWLENVSVFRKLLPLNVCLGLFIQTTCNKGRQYSLITPAIIDRLTTRKTEPGGCLFKVQQVTFESQCTSAKQVIETKKSHFHASYLASEGGFLRNLEAMRI